MNEPTKIPTESKCRCAKSSCGCAAAVVERCTCGEQCTCASACRCGAGCRCAAS